MQALNKIKEGLLINKQSVSYIIIILLCILSYYLWIQSTITKIYLFYFDEKSINDEWRAVENKLSFTNYKTITIDATDPKYSKIRKNFDIESLNIVKVFSNGIREYYNSDLMDNKSILEWVYNG